MAVPNNIYGNLAPYISDHLPQSLADSNNFFNPSYPKSKKYERLTKI